MQNSWVYLRNRIKYSWKDTVEKLILGGSARDTTRFSYRDVPAVNWHPSKQNSRPTSSRRLTACEELPGLYCTRGIIGEEDCEAIEKYILSVCKFPRQSDALSFKNLDNPGNLNKKWTWFEFDPGRFMSACHPSSSSSVLSVVPIGQLQDNHVRSLTDFEVYGNIPPSEWLDLNEDMENSDAAISKGAKALGRLQDSIASELNEIMGAADENQNLASKFKCVFIQFQLMEPGVNIMPHIDADDPKVDIITTLCIRGDKNGLRVGPVEFSLARGDLYLLAGFARHHVKHEVLSSSELRLTVTLRFVSMDPNYRNRDVNSCG